MNHELSLKVIEYLEGPLKVLSWKELEQTSGTAFENNI